MKRAAIERLLPTVYQITARIGPLAALLDAMEYLHEPDERALENVHDYFYPYVTPAAFVPYLAGWVDLDWLLADPTPGREEVFAPGLGRLRNLIAISHELSARRGTADGLRRFLETATGVQGFGIRDGERAGVSFHIVVEVPETAYPWGSLIERIVERERPAHATYEVRYAGPAAVDDETTPAEADTGSLDSRQEPP